MASHLPQPRLLLQYFRLIADRQPVLARGQSTGETVKDWGLGVLDLSFAMLLQLLAMRIGCPCHRRVAAPVRYSSVCCGHQHDLRVHGCVVCSCCCELHQCAQLGLPTSTPSRSQQHSRQV